MHFVSNFSGTNLAWKPSAQGTKLSELRLVSFTSGKIKDRVPVSAFLSKWETYMWANEGSSVLGSEGAVELVF